MDLDGLLEQDTRYSSLESMALTPFAIGERSRRTDLDAPGGPPPGCSYCSLRAVTRLVAPNAPAADTTATAIDGGCSDLLDGDSDSDFLVGCSDLRAASGDWSFAGD